MTTDLEALKKVRDDAQTALDNAVGNNAATENRINALTALLNVAQAKLEKAQGYPGKRSAEQGRNDSDRAAKSMRTMERAAVRVDRSDVIVPARSVGFSNEEQHWEAFFPNIKDHDMFWQEINGGLTSILAHKKNVPKSFDIRPRQLPRETQVYLWKVVYKVYTKIETNLVLGNEASQVLKWANVIQEFLHYLPEGNKTVSEIGDPVMDTMVVAAPQCEGGSSASSAPKYYFTKQVIDHEAWLRIPHVLKGPVELQLIRHMEAAPQQQLTGVTAPQQQPTGVTAPQQQPTGGQPAGQAAVRLKPVKVGALAAAAGLESQKKLKNKISQAVKEAAALHYLNTEVQDNHTQNQIRMIVADGAHFMMVVLQINSVWTKGMSSRDYQGTVRASPSYTLEISKGDTCLQAICLLADWLYTGSKRFETLTVADLEAAAAQKDAKYSAEAAEGERTLRDFLSREQADKTKL